MSNIVEIFALLWIIFTNIVTFGVIGVGAVYAWERYNRGKENLQ